MSKTKTFNKKRFFTVLIAILIFSVAFVGGFFFNSLLQGKTVREMRRIMGLIEDNAIFVTLDDEGKEISGDKLIKTVVKAVLEEDKYAKYYTKEELESEKMADKGLYSGLGIEAKGNLIVKVKGNSPSEKAGIKKGDKIVKAECNGNIKTFNDGDSMSDFFSSADGEITLNIDRNGENLVKKIRAESFTMSFVKYSDSGVSYNLIYEDKEVKKVGVDFSVENLAEDVCYISLAEFGEVSSIEFEFALNLMKERKRSKLILDLRDNGGGTVDSLSKIAGMLINNGGEESSLLIYSKTKNGQESYYMKNNFYDNLEKIVVLANEKTASASECLIGAMLYYGDLFSVDNLIISKDDSGNAHTYGKGILQTTYDLPSGSAIKFTTAIIYQPDKTTCIHEVGITTTSANSVDDNLALLRATDVINRL